ncbi:hypothetical protein NLG97_g11244 [Lecanicillium saksenae]|uniref:Uncharacterized protein n=1 Tax=Lecanicillium saksenae TaxID=468837 RepID=A0ACC1QCQ7_9HYPO|nr:hypothetical protein NLG97_g11244 [Lecanicillium saksenae]
MLLYEAGFAAVIVVTTLYTPRFPGTKMSGALGGFLISLSQLASIATRGSMIGISGSYGELGGLIWANLTGDKSGIPKSYPNVLFAVSAGAGALLLAKLFPALSKRRIRSCAAGRGAWSGISLLSTSSLITIATTFAAGFVVASLVY